MKVFANTTAFGDWLHTACKGPASNSACAYSCNGGQPRVVMQSSPASALLAAGCGLLTRRRYNLSGNTSFMETWATKAVLLLLLLLSAMGGITDAATNLSLT